MTWKFITVFLLFLLQLVTSETSAQSAGSPIIRLTGDNQTIAYNSNEDVTFNCEVETGNQVVWRVHFRQFDPGSNKTEVFDEYGIIINDIQTNFSQLILTETARQVFSLPELMVICLPLRFDPTLSNPPVRYITTYGPITAPRGLTLTAHNSNVFNFSWMKPEVPPGVQLISHIEVLNLTSRDFDVYNSTGEMIDLAFSQFGECSPFNITVFSSDGMTVNSELAFITENIPISPDVSTIKLNFTVDLRNGVSLILEFCPAEICSENYPVLNYTVNVLPSDVTSGTTITMNVTPAATSCDPPFSVILDSTHVPELARDQEHQLSVTACSSITCRTTDSVTTYTTGIQNSTVYYVNRTLLLTCDFALGSSASGCHFNFTLIRNKDGERVVEAFNLTRNSSRVNSTVCGESRTCMCVTTDNLPTTYSSIRAYTLESDKTLSGISVPVALNNSQNNQEIVNECIQLFAQPLVSGGLSGGGIAGIVISFIIIFAIVIPLAACLLFKLCLLMREKKEYEAFLKELKSEDEVGIIGDDRHLDRSPAAVELHPVEAKRSMVIVYLDNSSSASDGRGEFDKKLKTYEKEAFELKSGLGRVVYIDYPDEVDELTSLIEKLEQP